LSIADAVGGLIPRSRASADVVGGSHRPVIRKIDLRASSTASVWVSPQHEGGSRKEIGVTRVNSSPL